MSTLNLFISKNQITILKKKNLIYLYIYNNNFFFFFKVKNCNRLFVEKSTKCVSLTLNNTSSLNMTLNKYINDLLFSWNNFFFKKIKFIGKGYRIKKFKKKRIIKLKFNRSHINILRSGNNIIKKIRKTKILVANTHREELTKTSQTITNVRPVNLYTKRGLQIKRCVNYRKMSKKSPVN